ncbi:MAG: hypothetical protein M1829_006107 [Trizodia sp. TS-e1964]|nr:MAG: hypothetical protein M1829_006107 [Trizodia sp. TS-e1964]
MEPPSRPAHSSLFQVYLRLKPPQTPAIQSQTPLYPVLPGPERYLTVESPSLPTEHGMPTHITITPPSESRRRAVEKFAFTKVFQEDAQQLDIFKGSGLLPLIEAALGSDGRHGRDGLLATLGVTGSGKSHTILGSRTQRGLTQLTLDVLFRSLSNGSINSGNPALLKASLKFSDASEAQLDFATTYLDGIYGEVTQDRGISRQQTPIMEGLPPQSVPRRHLPARPINQPQLPNVDNMLVATDRNAEYLVLISMYEVYNDRIFDLLTGQATSLASSRNGIHRDLRRRPLLFKPTEQSPDRKLVAGLRKIVCRNIEEALMVLNTGLVERKVAGTGSNLASSRSHGFFCLEIKKRAKGSNRPWIGSTITIVDLAGSERARNAKTVGVTLAEAGKINESLMYLGQCLQMQSDSNEGNKSGVVPFRQCKLTELLFSNSFPSATPNTHNNASSHRNSQRAIMIVTADPLGDFNATSQILRYSALAREVTVPRIPSITSTILSGTTATKSGPTSGRTTPDGFSLDGMEYAASELTRLTEELDIMAVQLTEEERRRREAERAWQVAEERAMLVEQEIREECWREMELRIEEERRRWKFAWGEEADRNDEHMDKKLDILSQAMNIHEDTDALSQDRVEDVEAENAKLRLQLNQLTRKLQSRSPTKIRKTSALDSIVNMNAGSDDNLHSALQSMTALGLKEIQSPTSYNLSPKSLQTPVVGTACVKKQRKLYAKEWSAGPEGDPVFD